MKRITYENLRKAYIDSDNKLYFQFTDLLSSRSSEIEMFSYVLSSDNDLSNDFISVSYSKFDDSFISIDLFCSNDSSNREATTIIEKLISELPDSASITICDYNGNFVPYFQENSGVKLDNITQYKSYIYIDQSECVLFHTNDQAIRIHNLFNYPDSKDEIKKLIEVMPDWERHIQMSFDSLGNCSDAFYIIYNENQPIGFLSNIICTVEEYRDVAFILIQKEYRGKGLATMLARFYKQDTLKNQKIPLYTNAETIASEKVAQNAGFQYGYLCISADVITCER